MTIKLIIIGLISFFPQMKPEFFSILEDLVMDAPRIGQKLFQDPASPVMEGLIDLHHDLMFIIVLICIFVCWLLFYVYSHYVYDDEKFLIENNYTRFRMLSVHHTLLEIIWTVFPALILVWVAIPSFALLYASDEVIKPTLTLKAIGNQWYWSYEFSDFWGSDYIFNYFYTEDFVFEKPKFISDNDFIFNSKVKTNFIINFYTDNLVYDLNPGLVPDLEIRNSSELLSINDFSILMDFPPFFVSENLLVDDTINTFLAWHSFSHDSVNFAFDSYMINEDDLNFGSLRLLETDKRIIVPAYTHIRLLVTSNDVLHSWALPSAGIKIDACPGRLNQTDMFFQREGVFYGQCSEICGVNHAFMPIVVHAVSLELYKWYILANISSTPGLNYEVSQTLLAVDGTNPNLSIDDVKNSVTIREFHFDTFDLLSFNLNTTLKN